MKKTLLLTALLASLALGGCTSSQTIEKESNVNLFSVNEKYNKEVITVEGKEVSTDDFTMNLEFRTDMVIVAITNTSEEVIVIDWEYARYIGLDGKEQKTFDMKQKDRGVYERQMATPLREGQSYIAELVPINNINYLAGSSTGVGTVYIENKMFEEEVKKQDYAKLIVPITVNGVSKGTLETFDIYFGEGEKPEAIVRIEEDKKVVPVAPVKEEVKKEVKPAVEEAIVETLEIKEIQSENELLELQLKEQEALIKELNEKAELQKKIDEKQKEIDALMKELKK